MSLRPPLLTLEAQQALEAARAGGVARLELSLDLGRSRETVELETSGWRRGDALYPYTVECRERTVYHWTGEEKNHSIRRTYKPHSHIGHKR